MRASLILFLIFCNQLSCVPISCEPLALGRLQPLGRKPPGHAPRRFRDLFGITGEANTQMALAAGTEGAAGRSPNAGFVDEPQG